MIHAKRTQHRILPDPRRVLARPHIAAARHMFPDGSVEPKAVVHRLLAMPEPTVRSYLERTMRDFENRHHDFEHVLEHSYELVAGEIGTPPDISRERCLLIGAVFTLEYAIEAAALFNPSIVPAPDQTGVDPGACRFIMSLRAVGEGHISAIEFRSGMIDARNEITLDPTSPYVRTGERTSPRLSKEHICRMAGELGASREICATVMDPLPEKITAEQLERAMAGLYDGGFSRALAFETARIIHMVSSSNYKVTFPADWPMSERVLVPAGPRETQGMEDARFVRFMDDDGSATYYGTYTAFDGFSILPQLIETPDFNTFRILTMTGRYAQNKGMALFPRRIGGRCAALARHDRESLHIVFSDDVRTWEESELMLRPEHGWGILQIGNCGSPLETEAGWLVLTHGVGPVRRYSIGAALLDLEDPTRVIGELDGPLLEPNEDEREGYVPNVVYSCGAMVHGDVLVLPYGYSDYGTRIALVPMDELLSALGA